MTIQVQARDAGDSADVQFKFSQKDVWELLGKSPRLLAAWGQLAKVAVVTPAGERNELAVTPTRSEPYRPHPN